jgi:hypothetical protein
MAEPHRTYDQQQHVESHAPYGTVFFILLNFTALEYIYASFYETPVAKAIMMIVAAVVINIITTIAAAALHLHFNRKWVYLTMIPAVVLGSLQLGLVLGLMILAVTKATLVGMYFMHLKFEGNWVYYMLIPAAILATVFIVALYPDIGMQPGEESATEGEELVVAPVPASGTMLAYKP